MTNIKVIKVDNCYNCPNADQNCNEYGFCSLTNITFLHPEEILDECPLENLSQNITSNYDGYYKESSIPFLTTYKSAIMNMLKHRLIIKDENIENALNVLNREIEGRKLKEDSNYDETNKR